jgi:hypothetical protein
MVATSEQPKLGTLFYTVLVFYSFLKVKSKDIPITDRGGP